MVSGQRDRRIRVPAAGCLLFLVLLLAAGPPMGVSAQDPPPTPPLPDPDNLTAPDSGDAYQIQVETVNGFARIEERGVARYTVVVRDGRIEGTQYARSTVQVNCQKVNETPDAQGWAVVPQPIPVVGHQDEHHVPFLIVAASRPTPEYYSATFECRAGQPINDVVGNFTLRAQVSEYVYMSIRSVNTVPPVRPDQEVEFTVLVQNSGSHLKRFEGRIDAGEGWSFPNAPTVIIPPGESEEITITGIAPREQILYISGNDAVRITYAPEGSPGKAQTAFFPVTIKGLYLHPALLPVTILALAILGSVIFLAVLARRAIEEQILGKPVPPWRIPVEREYLQQLQREDPDEFYIVRYYLMVEEHESALLWFAAYKKATKKDRKRERKWVKVKSKQERKIGAVEKDHEKLEHKWDKKIAKVDKKRDRKIRKLERKLRRKERKAARGVGKRHKKKVRKIKKKHKKRVKKIHKKHEKQVAKETKKVDRQNRKRAKKGEELLPYPEIPPPEIDEPELPAMEEPKEVPLEESSYAGRAEKRRERAEAKKERLRLRKERAVARDRLKSDVKIEALRAKIPPEPTTHLYDSDEYIPDDQVVVEDDRPLVSKLLHIPTLEERDRIRRRRAVYQARLKAAKEADDPQKVEEIKRQQKEELTALKEARREELAVARAGDEEAARLKKERKRRAKEAAKERKERGTAPAEAPTETDAPASEKKIKPGLPVRLRKQAEESPAEAGSEASEAPPVDEAKGRGFKARFQRKKADDSAGSEEAKKEPTESSGEPTAQERS